MKFRLQIGEQKKQYDGYAGSLDEKELCFFDNDDQQIAKLSRPRLLSISKDSILIEGLQPVAPNRYKYINWYLRKRNEK